MGTSVISAPRFCYHCTQEIVPASFVKSIHQILTPTLTQIIGLLRMADPVPLCIIQRHCYNLGYLTVVFRKQTKTITGSGYLLK